MVCSLQNRVKLLPADLRPRRGRTRLSDVAVRFGRRLREVREGAGLSQERLAELATLHRTYVSSVERGKRNISLENIERLAVALGVSMRDLMPADPKPPRGG